MEPAIYPIEELPENAAKATYPKQIRVRSRQKSSRKASIDYTSRPTVPAETINTSEDRMFEVQGSRYKPI